MLFRDAFYPLAHPLPDSWRRADSFSAFVYLFHISKFCAGLFASGPIFPAGWGGTSLSQGCWQEGLSAGMGRSHLLSTGIHRPSADDQQLYDGLSLLGRRVCQPESCPLCHSVAGQWHHAVRWRLSCGCKSTQLHRLASKHCELSGVRWQRPVCDVRSAEECSNCRWRSLFGGKLTSEGLCPFSECSARLSPRFLKVSDK
jgi:hypothetical protein